ncbi:serine/threonine protein kinase [Colletotrichum tofieldiae]|uniref:Serine/threonine protein kinase (Mechanosensitive ion channel) n=1 Tax=Colletotrichum tofieldiae TaxID=708197 RepID=A0A166YF03_9PEZI|nr:serine/threonine protein kinase (mechanosensitive ion channel) [Colletotrichum tofieldiae]GKT56969.1 serine/threonine protein kinase [Colletotrichum tofieldiae]GKT78701.1 serine/threonine protein kinase [Colletotrichum tofieldiae]
MPGPLSPRHSGFLPINNTQSNDMPDSDIPLTQVRSAASTGARKPTMNTSNNEDSGSGTNEKHGLFHRSKGGRRKKHGELGRQGTGGSDEVKVNAMGRFYNKITGASVVTRYLVYIIPIGILLAIPLIVLPITDHRKDILVGGSRGKPLFDLFLWIEIAWLTLWAGKCVAWVLPHAFMFFCGVVSSGTRKYATVLQNLQIALSLFFWALASWQSFQSLFKASDGGDPAPWITTMIRLLGATFISSAVYLGEKAIVQLIGISYHQRSFALRIKESKREVRLLGLLYDASRTLFPMYCPEFEDEDYVINDSLDLYLAKAAKGGKGGAGSATPLRLVGDIGRMGDKITGVFGNIASEITGKQVFNPNSAHSIVVEALEKKKPSEALARRIWMSFVVEGKDSLYPEDFQEVLGPAYSDEAEEAFGMIDNDMNGDISLEEMTRKVVEIGKERKAITEGMKDIGQALRVFDKVLMFVVLLIVVFIFLAWFQSTLLTTVATAGTALLSLSFVFAVTTQEFLGSCIFLFVKHPYDVGDRVDIVGSEKLQLIVDKISLLYTVFTRIDKMQVVQVPNITLNNLWIENITRSKAMKEVIDLNVSYDTSFEDLELLRVEMENFVRNSDNSRDFMPDIAIGVAGVGDLDKLQLKIAIKHKSNWHNEAVRATRRSKFMCALAMALKKIPIYAPGGGSDALGAPGNPSYSVAVSDQFASSARDQAAKDKEAKRLVPSPAADGTDTNADSNTEKQAVQELNLRDPLAEEEWGYRVADEQTLSGSRDRRSEDRRRSNDIDRVRSQLLKRASTKGGGGRRKPGESIPMSPLGDGPGLNLTQTASRNRGYDEEAETGVPDSYSSAYYGSQSTNYPNYGQTLSPTISPPPQASGLTPHPLQSAPSGQRPRGRSVSNSQQQNEAAQGDQKKQ